MAFYRCNLIGGGGKNLDGLMIKNSGAAVPQQHQPSGGWSGNVTGSGTITIKFPKEIDLSQYNVNSGTINISDNTLSMAYTVRMTGSAGYYNANVSSSTIIITK